MVKNKELGRVIAELSKTWFGLGIIGRFLMLISLIFIIPLTILAHYFKFFVFIVILYFLFFMILKSQI